MHYVVVCNFSLNVEYNTCYLFIFLLGFTTCEILILVSPVSLCSLQGPHLYTAFTCSADNWIHSKLQLKRFLHSYGIDTYRFSVCLFFVEFEQSV